MDFDTQRDRMMMVSYRTAVSPLTEYFQRAADARVSRHGITQENVTKYIH